MLIIEVNDKRKAALYLILSQLYNNLSDYQKAIIFLEKARDLKIIIGDKLGEVKYHGDLGKFYRYILKHNDALTSFE